MADRTDSPCEAMSAGERVTLHRTRRRRNGKLTEYGPWYECDGIHVGGNWQHAPYVPAADLELYQKAAHDLAKRVEELENQRDEADDALAFVRNERDRALKRVEELERVADRYNLLLQQDLEIKYPRALAVVKAARNVARRMFVAQKPEERQQALYGLSDALAAFDKALDKD